MTDLFRNRYRIPSSRLQSWNYGDEGIYFITICTVGREIFFGDVTDRQMILSMIGKFAHEEWLRTSELRPDMKIELGEFVIMPNQYAWNSDYRCECEQWKTSRESIRTSAKKSCLRCSGLQICCNNFCPKNMILFDWQKGYHDHIIRSTEEFDRISLYILENPAKWINDKFHVIK